MSRELADTAMTLRLNYQNFITHPAIPYSMFIFPACLFPSAKHVFFPLVHLCTMLPFSGDYFNLYREMDSIQGDKLEDAFNIRQSGGCDSKRFGKCLCCLNKIEFHNVETTFIATSKATILFRVPFISFSKVNQKMRKRK